MKDEHKKQLLEIVQASNSCQVKFNVPVHDNYSNTYYLVILECNPKLVQDLVKEGFMLTLRDGKLIPDKI